MMQEMSQSEIVKCSHKLVVNMCICAVDSAVPVHKCDVLVCEKQWNFD